MSGIYDDESSCLILFLYTINIYGEVICLEAEQMVSQGPVIRESSGRVYSKIQYLSLKEKMSNIYVD